MAAELGEEVVDAFVLFLEELAEGLADVGFEVLGDVAPGTGCSSMRLLRSLRVGTKLERASTTHMRKSGGPGFVLRKLGDGR